MKQYKHYSFDLWGTLLKPNPAFNEARIEYFFDHFNRGKKSHKEIADVFKKVSDIHNTTAEVTGRGFSPAEMYTMVLYFLGYDMTHMELRDIHSIYLIMETMFIKNPPHLFPDTGHVLSKLRERGASLSVLSNTGYANGHTMRIILDNLQILQFFQFTLFSNETGTSKPNISIYNDMFTQVAHLNAMRCLSREDILHIGDSVKADINGANAAGITGFGVHFGNITLKNLLQ